MSVSEQMESKSSHNLIYAQIGAAALVIVATGFGVMSTLVGAILVFGVIGPFGAMYGPRFLGMARYYLYLAILSVIIVMTSNFFPFIGGKDYFFRFSTELALVCFILWWAFEAASGEAEALLKDIFKKPVFVAVTLFVVVFLLSTIFAYDTHAAFWSNYERGEGAFEMLHYYAFFTLLILLLKKETDWRAIFRVSLVAASLMILYGVFANVGWFNGFISIYQGGNVPSGFWARLTGGAARFQGSLGNPAYVAPYLMFAMFYAFYLWLSGKSDNNKWLRRLGYGLLIAIFLFFFVLSQTRGAFLGVGAAVFVYLAYLIIFGRVYRKRAAIWLASVMLLGVALLAVRNLPAVKNIPESRLLEINLSDQTAKTRLWTWGSAWQGFLEKPVLGWGAENFSAIFDKYFNPNHYVPGTNSETWFDRAHSIFLDYLTETGILGLLSYLGIFAVIFWGLFKSRNNPAAGEPLAQVSSGGGSQAVRASVAAQAGGRSQLIVALMLAMPAGYLVQGIAIFDVLPMYLNVFLFFAFSYHYLYNFRSRETPVFAGPKNLNQKSGRSEELKKLIGILISVLILLVAYFGAFLPLRKSQIFIETLRSINSARSLADLQKMMSVPLDYYSPVGQEELVRNTANTMLGVVQQNSDPQIIANVVDYIESYYKPIVARGHGMSFEQNLYLLGAINEMAFTKTSQLRYLQDAHKYYSEGLALGPKRPQTLYGMFDVYRIEGNVEGATGVAQQIMKQWPTDARTQQALAQFLTQVQAHNATSAEKGK